MFASDLEVNGPETEISAGNFNVTLACLFAIRATGSSVWASSQRIGQAPIREALECKLEWKLPATV